MVDTEIIVKFDPKIKIENTEYEFLKGNVRDSILVSNGLSYGSETRYLVKFDSDEKGSSLPKSIIKIINPNRITEILI